MSNKPAKKESKVEAAKRSSRNLRGTLAETLASDATHFVDDDTQVLKFHGVYQQDDRDQRRKLRAQGLEKDFQFMVRCAIPGGVMTADQYLALDEISETYGKGSLRVTTRQGLQFHGILKGDLKPTIAGIHDTLLTTLAACGDARRNVVSCPAPLADDTHALLRDLTVRIAEQLQPTTRAYHEIWLDHEKVASTEPEDAFYGTGYLPRKFKVGLALNSHNCVDIHTHDCGLVAILENHTVAGFNLLVGGGLGMTNGKPDTFAKLAEPLGFIAVENSVEAVRTVAAIFRDHGNRSDRRHARLKYLIADWGLQRFRDEFKRRVGFELRTPLASVSPTFDDHLGRHQQGDGKWFYGICLENGRIVDRVERRTKSALRKIVTEHRAGVVLTPQQNMLVTNLPEDALDRIELTLGNHGVAPVAELSAARRFSMACPALPTCGLAITESERLMPSVLDLFERELESLGLRNVPITVRMTGCPNGCVRTYTADVAFVGCGVDRYNVYVGGGLRGDRMADLFAADVHKDELLTVLRPLLRSWATQRQEGDGLSDFYQRLVPRDKPRISITGKEEPTQSTVLAGLDG